MYYLKCENDTHKPIYLPDKQPVSIGRSPVTKITDAKCSRKQVQITADYKAKKFTVKQMSSNPSFVDQEQIGKGNEVHVEENQTIFLVNQDYPHRIYKDTSKEKGNKRTLNDFFKPSNKKQKVETDKGNVSSDDESEILQKLQAFKKNPSKQKSSKVDAVATTSTVSKGSWEPSKKPQQWETYDHFMLFWPNSLHHSDKIIAFDMDGTLITTNSGKTFAVDRNDWKILYAEIPRKLKELHKKGYKLVIITNQMGVATKKVTPVDLEHKIEAVVKKLGVPIQVLAIIKRGKYRKPNIGIWEWLEQNGNGGIPINKDLSMYVGDAAGRPKDWAPKKKKDFSCSDRLFAINLGINFKSPEEFFMDHKPAKFDMPAFDPRSIQLDTPLTSDDTEITKDEQELILLVGYPACGKSSFAKNHLASKGYVIINRDILKTWQKCVKACKENLANGKSVVIDNTNPDEESRKRYISCAIERKCPCRCFVMDVSLEHAFHNNRFRELSDSDHAHVPRMVFYQHRKQYKEPSLKEGFTEIVKINFVPKFDDSKTFAEYQLFND